MARVAGGTSTVVLNLVDDRNQRPFPEVEGHPEAQVLVGDVPQVLGVTGARSTLLLHVGAPRQLSVGPLGGSYRLSQVQ